MNTAARVAPAVARNREPILEVLRRVLPESGLVLEIASGTGEHAAWLSAARPDLSWLPTDRDDSALASIAAWRETVAQPNLLAPLALDAERPATWPVRRADAVVAINMIHISPWAATQGLVAGAAQILPPGGLLYLYGPFREGGAHTAPSNEAFDADLRARDPAWGVRDLDEVAALAAREVIEFVEIVRMPANNLSVVFRRRADEASLSTTKID